MTPKQRVAVFVKAQTTGQLKNKQALNTYLADWPQIKQSSSHHQRHRKIQITLLKKGNPLCP